MTITLLDDNTSPQPYTPSGNMNPQTGKYTFNLVIVTPDANFKNTQFTFDTYTYTGGAAYDFPTSVNANKPQPQAATINNVPAQDGLNIYDFELLGKKHQILLMVSGGQVQWGSIAGGGDANWGAPNLFIGGLE